MTSFTTRPVQLVIAAAALLLAGGFSAADAMQGSDRTPSRYVQMNSPGDGISSGAARTGNGRTTRRMRRMKRRHR